MMKNNFNPFMLPIKPEPPANLTYNPLSLPISYNSGANNNNNNNNNSGSNNN